MRVAADLAGDGEEPIEIEVAGIGRGDAVTVPGRGAVEANFVFGCGGLERFEREPNAALELGARHLVELHLQIMQIINIDGAQAEITPAAFDLIAEIFRCHAMAAADDIFPAQYAGL